MKYIIIVFKYRDWEALTVAGKIATFDSEGEAETFVQKYPRSGADWSKPIREGNWQVIPDNTKESES